MLSLKFSGAFRAVLPARHGGGTGATEEGSPLGEPARQTTYDLLLDRILSGHYPPAMRLVNRTVAEELGVSVVPIREALGRLTSEGLVEHIPGAGSFVRALDNRSLAKLYALREQLEAFAVTEATRHAQAYQLQGLHRCCDTMAEILQRMAAGADGASQESAVEQWIASDAAFHRAIIEAADNPWLGLAVERLRVLAQVSRAKPRHLATHVYEQALQEHRAIARAIEDGDGPGAEMLMRTHIQRAMNAVLTGDYGRA
jgi:DNA-binding GntR family transcriptional regulator